MANYQRNTNLPINPLSNAILGVSFPKGNPSSNGNGYNFAISSGVARTDTIKYSVMGANRPLSDKKDRIRSYAKTDRTSSTPSGYASTGLPTYGNGKINRSTSWSLDDNLSKIEVSFGNGQRPISQQIEINIAPPVPPTVTTVVGPDVLITYCEVNTTVGVSVGFDSNILEFTGVLANIDITDGSGTIHPTSYSIDTGILRLNTARAVSVGGSILFNDGASGFVFANSGVLIAPFTASINLPA